MKGYGYGLNRALLRKEVRTRFWIVMGFGMAWIGFEKGSSKQGGQNDHLDRAGFAYGLDRV